MSHLFRSLIIFFSVLSFPIFSEGPTTETAIDKQSKLLEKNKKRQEEILEKYNVFYKGLQARFPDLNFSDLPIDITNMKDLKVHNSAPGLNEKKIKSIFVSANDFFILKTEPSYLPKFNSNIKVKKGEKLEVVLVLKKENTNKSENPNWCLVRTKANKEGYITQNLLNGNNTNIKSRRAEISIDTMSSLIDSDSSDQKKQTTSELAEKIFWVNASSLNLRNDPDVNAYIIAKLPKGEKAEVKFSTMETDFVDGLESRWHFVTTNYGAGWLYGGYLSDTEVSSYSNTSENQANYPSENPEDLKPGEKRYVRSTSLRLRDEPNEFGSVIITIPGDEKIQIIDVKKSEETISGVRSKWIYIKWANDWEGWVFGGFVSKEKGQLVMSDDISKYFQIPVDNDRYVSSSFGTRIDPVTGKQGSFHSGIDLPASIGTPIKSVSDGLVWKTITTSGGYGILTIISHKNNIYTYYAHQNLRKVKEGDRILSGDIIGEVGNTGKSTGPHLHFEVRKGPSQEALDPNAFLPK